LTLEPLLTKSTIPEEKSQTLVDIKKDEMSELMLELQDIVEQIDFARDLMTMGGIPFLLGCANERDVIPQSIRQSCLAVLATMTQNNPPVQDALLTRENGLSILGKLFFEESQTQEQDADGKMRSRVLQAISCSIRGHVVGEESFCRNSNLRSILDLGLGAVAMVPAGSSSNISDVEMMRRVPPLTLRKKSLFLLRALLTSDTSSCQRVRDFSQSLEKVIENVVSTTQEDADLIETSLALLLSILRQKNSVNTLLDKKNAIVGRGVMRIAEIRQLNGDEKDFAQTELSLWENVIVEMSRAERDTEEENTESETLLLADSPANPPPETFPQ